MWRELGSVAHILSGYPFRAAVRSEPGGEIAVVQLYDLATQGGSVDASVARVANVEGKYERYRLKVGDVLFQARGTAHPASVVVLGWPAIASPGLYVLRTRPDVLRPEYLAWCINHPEIQARLATTAQGTHAPFVSKQTLGILQIPTPPLAVQDSIARVSGLRERERQLTAQLSAAQDRLVASATWQAAISAS